MFTATCVSLNMTFTPFHHRSFGVQRHDYRLCVVSASLWERVRAPGCTRVFPV